MTIHELYEAYRTGPGEDRLLGLLRGAQDFVHNLCYQVLRHPQDAEDAAQKVLLKVLDVLPRVSDGMHLKSLLVRISFQVALNLSDARATRARHERRKAAMTPPSAPVDPEDLHALHRAVAALDPSLGELVVERYFDGKSLDGMASGRGCSVAAVWKRLEKAKGILRRSLVRAGLGTLAAQLGSRLEAMTFAPSPRDLISPAIATKAHAVAQAAAHTSMAGGAAGIGFVSVRTAALGFFSLLLGASAGGVLVALSQDGDAPPTAAIPGIERSAASARMPGVSPKAAAPVALLASEAPRDLRARLREFRDLLTGPKKVRIAAEAQRRELDKRFHSTIPDELLQARSRLEETEKSLAGLMARGWKEFHQDVRENPSTYASVLLEAESGDACFELLELFAPFAPPSQGTQQGFLQREDLPAPVSQALEVLLASGSAEQKLAVFEAVLMKTFQDPGIETTCVRFLGETDPRLQERALWIMKAAKSLDRHLDALKGCWKRTSDEYVMEYALDALDGAERPEARALYWDFAREILERSAARPTGDFSAWRRVFLHPPLREEEEQFAALAAWALKRKFDRENRTALVIVLEGTLNLPLERGLRILDQARPSLDPVLGIAVGRMADQIRAGETRPQSLLRTFYLALPLPKED
jgi:RNA polymerase sigma factor (sigma-70 family)